MRIAQGISSLSGILSVLLVSSFAVQSSGQVLSSNPASGVVVLDAAGASPGTYHVIVTVDAAGNVSAALAGNVLRLTGSPVPNPPNPATLRGKVSSAAMNVNDPDKLNSAASLSIAYGQVADLVKSGRLKTIEQAADFQRRLNEQLLSGSNDAWKPFADALNAAVAGIEWTPATIESTWREIAAGLRDAAEAEEVGIFNRNPGGERRKIDWERLLQIVQIIMKLLLELGL